MSAPSDTPSRVVPAQLSFLAIYNPSLGNTDETVSEQIVYYKSKTNLDGGRSENRGERKTEEPDAEENEKLRQVGLAQGMVDFVKNFSNGAPVDSIDTQKSRLVLHELEPGWWILASVDLTRLPAGRPSGVADDQTRLSVEYSAREVSPSQLLLKQLVQANSLFLLHHAPSLQDLYRRLERPAFCDLLDKFWNGFTSDWDVLLHGNPAVDIYSGVKLASGGELGVGVGEEEWGSGEREVLEDFVGRTEGLIDLVVSRFGDEPAKTLRSNSSEKRISGTQDQPEPWLGTDKDAGPSDGVIFSGTGAVSRKALATVSQWVEAIFKYGEHAYGVGENPSSRVRKKRRQTPLRKSKQQSQQPILFAENEAPSSVGSPKGHRPNLRRKAMENNAAPPGIPPPIVANVERSLDAAVAKAHAREDRRSPRKEKSEEEATGHSSMFDTENMMRYLKLGYGSSWTLSPNGLPSDQADDADKGNSASSPPDLPRTHSRSDANSHLPDEPLQHLDPTPELGDEEESTFTQRLEQSIGKFIIGLSGDLENTEFDDDQDLEDKKYPKTQTSQRVFLRTLTIEMAKPQAEPRYVRPSSRESNRSTSGTKAPPTSAAASIDGTHPIVLYQKLQVAVYVHQPFIFVFLFGLHTSCLTMPSFYRNIHHQLGPLQTPLLKSTDPAKVAEKIADAMGDRRSTTSSSEEHAFGQLIYDVIYDPVKMTVRTSLPNIPIPGSLAAEGLMSQSPVVTVSGSWYTLGIPISSSPHVPQTQAPSSLVQSDWTRIEALNVHSQILNTWLATRSGAELERTVKTGRGWWILWMRVRGQTGDNREAFLVRKAGDHRLAASRPKDSSGGKWLLSEQIRDVSGSSTRSTNAGALTTPAGVSEGVGVDARKYIDGLLHFLR